MKVLYKFKEFLNLNNYKFKAVDPKEVELNYKSQGNGYIIFLVNPVMNAEYVWQFCKAGTASWEELKVTDIEYYSLTINSLTHIGDKYRCLIRIDKKIVYYSKVITLDINSFRSSNEDSTNYQRQYKHKQSEQKQQHHRKENQRDDSQTELTFDFFKGCSSWEQVKERYKNQMKTYHPDTGSGDEETTKAINLQYEKLKQKYNQ